MQQATEDARALARVMQADCIGSRISRLHRVALRRYELALRPLGVTLPQLEVLSALTLIDGPVRPARLAEILAVERSTMSRNLTLLEANGLIAAATTSVSGRTLAVTITDEGTGLLALARTAWTTAQADVADLLGHSAQGTLDTWIAKLTDSG